jgi:riboflavin synthase alpha subunit
MFTGLIREIGTLRSLSSGPQLSRLEIHAPATAPRVGDGDSLAVDGICLTVTAVRGELVRVEAAAETRRVTTLTGWRVGRRLHLEPSLRAGDPIDGHLVLGHVDGTGRVVALERRGASVNLTVRCGEELARWLMPKGSVAVDGVSLTVDAGPHVDRFTVNLIPHSLRWTTFAAARPGRVVNLEMDVLVMAARTGRTAEALAGLGVSGAENAAGPASRASVSSLASILDRGFNRRGRS